MAPVVISPKRTVLAAMTLVALISLAGCSATGAASDDDPTAGATSVPPVTCPKPDGGACLGLLAGGSHTTSQFNPRLTFAAPGGWFNAEDLPGNLLFYRDADRQDGPLGGSYVGVYRDVRAAAQDCREAAEPGIGGTSHELADWLGSNPGITASEPQPVSVGGLDGLTIDIALDPSWTGTCPWSGGLPVVALVIGGGVSQLHHVLLGGMSIRLYLLDHHDGNVIIEATSIDEQISADDYRAAAEPLITSFAFAP